MIDRTLEPSNVRTRVLLCLLVCAWGGVCLPENKGFAEQTRPNIVVILADDLGKGDLSPRLMPRCSELLQQKGTTLHFYSMQSCMPTRAAFLTGKHPFRFDLHSVHATAIEPGLPVSEVTLSQRLSNAGYSTGMFGKWHLGWQDRGQWPNAKGFDEFVGCLGGHIEYFGSVGNRVSVSGCNDGARSPRDA